MSTWIKLYRKVLENPVVCKDAETFAIWSYLLLKATHKPYKNYHGGELIELNPGQLITGRKKISSHFNMSESKVQRVLKKLENEQLIEQQTKSTNRLITILNWCNYQNNEHQSEQRMNNERTTNEQRVNTIQEHKNIRTKEHKNKDIKYMRKNSANVGVYSEKFISFWEVYPKKKAKASAYKIFKKLKVDDELLNQMLTAIEQFKNSKDWKKDSGQYIPYPATWLNQRRWEDEIIEDKSDYQKQVERLEQWI